MAQRLGTAADLAAVAQSYVAGRPGVPPVSIRVLGELPLNLDEHFCREVADLFERAPLLSWHDELAEGYEY